MSKISIRSRIVIAFTLIALFVGGAFTLGIHSIFDSTEDKLMSIAMDTKLRLIVTNSSHSNETLKELGLHLYSSEYPDPAIPKYLSSVPDGFSEIKKKPVTYFVYRQTINGHDYILVQDQSLFENEFEYNVFFALRSGFLFTVLVGGLFGWLLARQILSPIVKLSHVFSQRKQQPLGERIIAEEFSDDEIGSLAQSFEDAYTKIKDALWRERLFTSDVSHEFRSGLMIISSSCELLLQHRSKEDADYEMIDRIARASSEMQQLLQSLLMIARAERTVVNPSSTQTLAQISQEAFNRWQLDFSRKKIAFSLVKKGALSDEKVNADLLLAVLSNLLRNALNYTESGNVRIVLNESSISVVDTGVGIDLDQQHQVLKPFVRGSALPLDGLGLGLSLIQRICENQGWRLSLHSEPGRGSTFTISF
ncbi:HAMP domain-containing sensor histidine kinase [Methylophilus sp. Q8]|uniref:sensor histidine kinase n=1 Tax=Methylophilus sp. Q8 TaxID=1506586 RepID=UPI00064609AB|nr:HAMP domain-containing sensor histidine kinase [Methylophilus sp. Q8]